MRPLISYSKNIYSQYGEDGIIDQIFRILKTDKIRWCVEFGAWDGINFSNTRNLLLKKTWYGVLIEASEKRFKQLQETYDKNGRVLCFNKFVDLSGKNSLDNILKKTKIPADFDLLSVDIDGNDYHVWKSLKKYKPRVVVIEFNPTIPHDISFIQKPNFNVFQGSSLYALTKLANLKGYELVATTDANAFFVIKNLFPKFKIENNSLSKLHNNSMYLTKVFQLYDGTLVFEGCTKMLWHGVDFDIEKLQPLPRLLRRFPGRLTTVLTKIYFKGLVGLFEVFKLIRDL